MKFEASELDAGACSALVSGSGALFMQAIALVAVTDYVFGLALVFENIVMQKDGAWS